MNRPADFHGPLARFIDACTAAGRPPGAAWSVGEPGRVLSCGVAGSASLEPERVVAARDTLFDLASLTKPLATALIAVLLEQDGELDLDRPLSHWFPEAASGPYGGATLLDLGAHRAGLPAWVPLYAAVDDPSRFPDTILDLPPACLAGETLYSDLGYILLGKVLEAVSGSTLDRLFHERVAGPAALGSASFPGTDGCGQGAAATERGNRYESALAGQRAAGYRFREGMIRGVVHDGNAWAMGGVAGHAGLFSALDDVVALAWEILGSGRLHLGHRGRRRLLEPVAPGCRTFGFETGPGSAAAAAVLPDRAVGHCGFTGTSIWLDPDSSRYWILLTNRVHPVADSGSFQPVRREFHRLSAGPVKG